MARVIFKPLIDNPRNPVYAPQAGELFMTPDCEPYMKNPATNEIQEFASLSPNAQANADFQVSRERVRTDYLASGFKNTGRHRTNNAGMAHILGEGIWAVSSKSGAATPNTIYMGTHKHLESEGASASFYPIAVVDGVQVHLNAGDDQLFDIAMPKAPDGLDYNTEVRRFTSLADAIISGGTGLTKSVLHRRDFIFLEVWAERIDQKDVVYPFGNVHYRSNYYKGIPLSNQLVSAGYSAHGKWQESDPSHQPVAGYAAAWGGLTTAQKKVFLNDPRNNIYFDSTVGAYVQYRYRIRVEKGLGSNWNHVRNGRDGSKYAAYGVIEAGVDNINNDLFVVPKGSRVDNYDLASLNSIVGSSGNNHDVFMSATSLSLPQSVLERHQQDANLYVARNYVTGDAPSAETTFSEILMIPIGFVQRFNTGAFHIAYNFYGTAGTGDSTNPAVPNPWYMANARKPATTSDCFDTAKGRTTDETSGSWAGGPAKAASTGVYKFHDEISVGLFEDLRLFTNDITKYDIVNNTVGALAVPVVYDYAIGEPGRLLADDTPVFYGVQSPRRTDPLYANDNSASLPTYEGTFSLAISSNRQSISVLTTALPKWNTREIKAFVINNHRYAVTRKTNLRYYVDSAVGINTAVTPAKGNFSDGEDATYVEFFSIDIAIEYEDKYDGKFAIVPCYEVFASTAQMIAEFPQGFYGMYGTYDTKSGQVGVSSAVLEVTLNRKVVTNDETYHTLLTKEDRTIALNWQLGDASIASFYNVRNNGISTMAQEPKMVRLIGYDTWASRFEKIDTNVPAHMFSKSLYIGYALPFVHLAQDVLNKFVKLGVATASNLVELPLSAISNAVTPKFNYDSLQDPAVAGRLMFMVGLYEKDGLYYALLAANYGLGESGNANEYAQFTYDKVLISKRPVGVAKRIFDYNNRILPVLVNQNQG